MVKEPVHLSDWIQYLLHKTNGGYVIIFGGLTIIVMIIIGFYFYLGLDKLILSVFATVAEVCIIIRVLPKFIKARNLLDEIMKEKMTNTEEIKRKWFEEKETIPKSGSQKDKNGNIPYDKFVFVGLLFFGILLIILGIVKYLSGDFPLMLAIDSIGVSLIGLAIAFESRELGISSIKISEESKRIADLSDKKMSALTNLNFDEKIVMFGKYKTAINNRKTILEQIKQKEINQKQLTKKEKSLREVITKEIQEYLEQFKGDLQAVSNLTSYLDDLQKRKVINEYITSIIEDAFSFNTKNLVNEIKKIQEKFE
jgi:hypothetical protein